jgi:hypothetical protein
MAGRGRAALGPVPATDPMWLVLCERADLDAHWAAAGLVRRGLEPIELVHADELAAATRWQHRVGPDGCSVTVELVDGRTLSSAEIRGTLNRLVQTPSAPLLRAAPGDREYAREELHAFALSWLAALPGPVLNRPTPQGLSGPWLHRSEWLALAARAGLATPPFRSDDAESEGRGRSPAASVIVVGAKAFGPPGVPALADACGRLARLVGAALLEVAFDPDGLFAAATTLPALRPGGDPLLDALAGALG